jgi:hypothetical protein
LPHSQEKLLDRQPQAVREMRNVLGLTQLEKLSRRSSPPLYAAAADCPLNNAPLNGRLYE